MKSGAWNVPSTRRKMLALRPTPPGPSSMLVTVNVGVPSARAWSRTGDDPVGEGVAAGGGEVPGQQQVVALDAVRRQAR